MKYFNAALDTNAASYTNATHLTLQSALRAEHCAQQVVAGFQRYDANFSALTNRAMERFAEHDWQGSQQDALERIELHDQFINQTIATIDDVFGELIRQRSFWSDVKQHYTQLIAPLPANELCGTFFSCITRRLFKRADGSPDIEFGALDAALLDHDQHRMPIRQVRGRNSLPALAEQLLRSMSLPVEWRNLQGSAVQLSEQISQFLASQRLPTTMLFIESIDPAFYRFSSAYVVGRITGAGFQLPMAIALSNSEDGLVIDNVMLTEAELRNLFRADRSPFHVDLGHMADAIRYLSSLLPNTTVDELFMALGRVRQDFSTAPPHPVN
jgi:isocitrate dehydrogenase kinase/phosphatase